MATTPKQTVTINNVPYKLADLSDVANKQLVNIRVADQEIDRLENLLSMCKAARTTYARALDRALPKLPKAQLQ